MLDLIKKIVGTKNDREIKKETEDKLVAFLDGFAKTFA